jgi:hypothetical protein
MCVCSILKKQINLDEFNSLTLVFAAKGNLRYSAKYGKMKICKFLKRNVFERGRRSVVDRPLLR